MKYRMLGSTGVEVSGFCLGAMMFGAWGNPDHDDCVELIGRAADAGINFIDTADVYGQGESEEIVGKAIAGRRDEFVIATKCHQQMGEDRNSRGGSRRWVTRAVDDSLRRLGTDRIDLFQIHRMPWGTDIDETLGALSDMVRRGKVINIGSSTFPADQIVEAQWVAERRGRERFVCEQPQYSLFARSAEVAVLPTCERYTMGVIPWSPLSGGWLTGKYRRGEAAPSGSRFSGGSGPGFGRSVTDDRNAEVRFDLVERLETIAGEAALSMTQLALGFVDAHPAITATIIGPKTVEQLDELLLAADVVLDNDVLDAIDGVVKPGHDVPGVIHQDGNPALSNTRLRRRVV